MQTRQKSSHHYGPIALKSLCWNQRHIFNFFTRFSIAIVCSSCRFYFSYVSAFDNHGFYWSRKVYSLSMIILFSWSHINSTGRVLFFFFSPCAFASIPVLFRNSLKAFSFISAWLQRAFVVVVWNFLVNFLLLCVDGKCPFFPVLFHFAFLRISLLLTCNFSCWFVIYNVCFWWSSFISCTYQINGSTESSMEKKRTKNKNGRRKKYTRPTNLDEIHAHRMNVVNVHIRSTICVVSNVDMHVSIAFTSSRIRKMVFGILFFSLSSPIFLFPFV